MPCSLACSLFLQLDGSLQGDLHHLGEAGFPLLGGERLAGDEVVGERFATKNVYHITERGREYMESLMTDLSLCPPKVLMDFNAVVCNLNKVEKSTALALIKNIISGIEQSKQYYQSSLKDHTDIPLVGRTIMEQQEKVCVTLLEWAHNLYESYMEESDEKL